MKRAEVYKLGQMWLFAQEDGKQWVADSGKYFARFYTHAEALAHALVEVGLAEKNTEKENPNA